MFHIFDYFLSLTSLITVPINCLDFCD